jgi:hypothetical protein
VESIGVDDVSQTGPAPSASDAASADEPEDPPDQAAQPGPDDNVPLGEMLTDDGAPSAADRAAVPQPAATGRFALLRKRLPHLRRPRLNTRRRQAGAVAGVALVGLLAAGAFVVVPRSPGAAPDAARSVEPSGSSALSVQPSAGATEPTHATPDSSPGTTGAADSPVAIPSQTAPTASIIFTNLALDAMSDPNRTARTFVFTSDGPGAVSAEVVVSSPADTTRLCMSVDGGKAICREGVTPGVSSVITGTDHSLWTVTLISANDNSPTVDVAFRWPSIQPSIGLTSARFQGSPNPDSLRSLQATIKPRAPGRVTLDAQWGSPAVTASVTLADVSTARPATVDLVRYPNATFLSPAYSHSLAVGKTYRIELLNESLDLARPSLSATIAFP